MDYQKTTCQMAVETMVQPRAKTLLMPHEGDTESVWDQYWIKRFIDIWTEENEAQSSTEGLDQQRSHARGHR